MLKRKFSQKEQGFTLLEVVVSILIMTIFISVSLQLMAIAALLKAKARVSTEAISWIQQDMELIKYQAQIYQNTFLSANANLNASTITVNSATDFANTDKVIIGSDTNIYTISSISVNIISSISVYTLTISPNLTQAATQNAQVVAITRCSTTTTPTTITTGFADGLRDKIRDVALATPSTPPISNLAITTTSNTVTIPKKIATTKRHII